MSSATASTARSDGVRIEGDYQQFELDGDGMVVSVGDRMRAKAEALQASGLPADFCAGKSVLELGTDHGCWAFLASSAGARQVLALDRNRVVRDRGQVDLIAQNTALARRYPKHDRVHFRHANLGAQWHEFGVFDVVLAMSVTHHVYAQCGDLNPVWFWLARHTVPGGLLIWEGPTSDEDTVIRKDVPAALQPGYNAIAIEAAARPYFDIVARVPAGHEPTRQFWICQRRDTQAGSALDGFTLLDGAKGASKAFQRDGGRRMNEIEAILGPRPIAGSLNVALDKPFDWHGHYYRAPILDSTNRKDPAAPWAPRWCRFYPVAVAGVGCWAMRFEGERYDGAFMELIAPYRLRDLIEASAIVQAGGFWWPKAGATPVQVILDEVRILDDVIDHCRGRAVAVQAGGNVGVFPDRLAKSFDRVVTFEPDAANFACLRGNLGGNPRIAKHRAFLGAKPGTAGLMQVPHNAGAHYLSGDGDIPVMTIDGLNLEQCDFICLDVEGGEAGALEGAAQTIAHYQPIVMFEEKGLSVRYRIPEGHAEKWLRERFGYRVIGRTNHDVVMGPIVAYLHDVRAGEVLRRLPQDRAVRGAEIGAERGFMSQSLLARREDLFLVMVDAWEAGGGPYADPASDYHAALSPQMVDEYRKAAIANTAFAADRRQVIHARSVAAAAQVPAGSLDFVFIDADHSYEGCRSDIEAWWPAVVPGGLFGGHDYGSDAFEGVQRAVDAFVARTGLALSLGDNKTWFVTKPEGV